MFKIQFAQYINDKLAENDWTYKDLNGRSGVPTSTISAYAQGKVSNPDEDNLLRIVKAFGDPPEVLQQMRRAALPSTVAENKLIAGASDQERMEKFAALMRSNMLSVMEEYRAASAAQQTEIINHADRRIEEERQRASALNAKVLTQCNEEIERSRRHHEELMALKDQMIESVQQERDRVRAYLKSIIRNLTIALVAVAIFSAVGFAALGGYAVYAYNAFDRADPTRGIYRMEDTPEPEFFYQE